MSLLTPTSVSLEGGAVLGGLAVLAVPDYDPATVLLPMQWTEFCYACHRDCTFATFEVCAEGLVVECTGCGEERIAPFSRANGEAA